jgi:hypothetical protein
MLERIVHSMLEGFEVDHVDDVGGIVFVIKPP